MASNRSISAVAEKALGDFLVQTGRVDHTFSSDTHLLNDLGLCSDEGVDFVLDLCNAFQFEFPMEFNPFVDASGTSGLTFGQMVDAIDSFLPTSEVNQ